MNCSVCGRIGTKYKNWPWRHCAFEYGFHLPDRFLCGRCTSDLERYAAKRDLHGEHAGVAWLSARTGTISAHCADPSKRVRRAVLDSPQRVVRRHEARDRVDQLETELSDYVYNRDDKELTDWSEDDLDELILDRSWWPVHNELVKLCKRWNLASPYRDEEWEPLSWA